MSLKNSNDAIGNRTRDLPVCSVVHVRNITDYNATADDQLDDSCLVPSGGEFSLQLDAHVNSERHNVPCLQGPERALYDSLLSGAYQN